MAPGQGASSATRGAPTTSQEQSKSVESIGVIKTIFTQALELYMTMNIARNERSAGLTAKIDDIVCKRTALGTPRVEWPTEINNFQKRQVKRQKRAGSRVSKLVNQSFKIVGDLEASKYWTGRTWIYRCSLHVWWWVSLHRLISDQSLCFNALKPLEHVPATN